MLPGIIIVWKSTKCASVIAAFLFLAIIQIIFNMFFEGEPGISSSVNDKVLKYDNVTLD